jgi:hypothetical protein
MRLKTQGMALNDCETQIMVYFAPLPEFNKIKCMLNVTIQHGTKDCHSGRILAGIQILEDRKNGSPIASLGDDRRFFLLL